WKRARGATVTAQTPFSRQWEQLLADAGLHKAFEQGDAERDARHLMQAGLLAITPPKYRPERIQRVRIPLDAETRWQAAFNFVAPISPDAQRISNYEWSP